MSLFKGETPIGVVLVGEGASIETTTEQIAIQTTQPTDPNVDLWINPNEISQSIPSLPIQNQYSESTTEVYSADYINKNVGEKCETPVLQNRMPDMEVVATCDGGRTELYPLENGYGIDSSAATGTYNITYTLKEDIYSLRVTVTHDGFYGNAELVLIRASESTPEVISCPAGFLNAGQYGLIIDNLIAGDQITIRNESFSGIPELGELSGEPTLTFTFSDFYQIRTTGVKEYVDYYNNERYSTKEIKIGTWIDGKPLYRKVISVGSINGTNVKTLSLPSDMDILLPYEGILFDSDNNEYPLNYFNIYNAGQNIGSFYYKSRGLQIKCDADFGIINGYVIIKYTKTTD